MCSKIAGIANRMTRELRALVARRWTTTPATRPDSRALHKGAPQNTIAARESDRPTRVRLLAVTISVGVTIAAHHNARADHNSTFGQSGLSGKSWLPHSGQR